MTSLCFFGVIILKLLFTIFQDFEEGHNLCTPPFTPFPLLCRARSPSTLAIGELPIGGTHMLEAVAAISFYTIARKNIMSGFRTSEPQSRTKVFGLAPNLTISASISSVPYFSLDFLSFSIDDKKSSGGDIC